MWFVYGFTLWCNFIHYFPVDKRVVFDSVTAMFVVICGRLTGPGRACSNSSKIEIMCLLSQRLWNYYSGATMPLCIRTHSITIIVLLKRQFAAHSFETNNHSDSYGKVIRLNFTNKMNISDFITSKIWGVNKSIHAANANRPNSIISDRLLAFYTFWIASN